MATPLISMGKTEAAATSIGQGHTARLEQGERDREAINNTKKKKNVSGKIQFAVLPAS